MNRRELLKNVAAGTVSLFVVPAVLTSCEDETPEVPDSGNPNELTIDLTDSKYSALTSAGGSVIETGIIIINTGSEYIALSSVCTHKGCEVSYDHASSKLPCPCHGSEFSTSGSVLMGPATTPLAKYDVTQDGDILTIPL